VLGPALASGPAPAADAARPLASGGWQFSLTPYFWAAGLDGDVGVGGRTASVDVGFNDIADALDMGALLTFEAQKQRWGLLLDAIYLKLSTDEATPGPLFSNVDLGVKQTVLEGDIAYRVIEQERGGLDVLAGVRYWNLDTELDFGAGLLPGVELSQNKDWVDPVVGVRYVTPLTERWSLRLRGDIGGFGVSSDFTWQAFAGVGYDLSDRFSVAFGYRHLDVDFEDDGFTFDVATSGPALGASIRF
jgi:opacity protein-like surface antigen